MLALAQPLTAACNPIPAHLPAQWANRLWSQEQEHSEKGHLVRVQAAGSDTDMAAASTPTPAVREAAAPLSADAQRKVTVSAIAAELTSIMGSVSEELRPEWGHPNRVQRWQELVSSATTPQVRLTGHYQCCISRLLALEGKLRLVQMHIFDGGAVPDVSQACISNFSVPRGCCRANVLQRQF